MWNLPPGTLTVPSGHFFTSGGGALALIAALVDAVVVGVAGFFFPNAKYAPNPPPTIARTPTTTKSIEPPFDWFCAGSVVFAVGTGSACEGASAVCAISPAKIG